MERFNYVAMIFGHGRGGDLEACVKLIDFGAGFVRATPLDFDKVFDLGTSSCASYPSPVRTTAEQSTPSGAKGGTPRFPPSLVVQISSP